MSPDQPEVWLRGPVDGYAPLLMPIVHTLLQVREDIDRLVATVPPDRVWVRPGAAASIGFHIRHAGGALDRLFTYARGEALTDDQKVALRDERVPGDPPADLERLAAEVHRIIDAALHQLQRTSTDSLLNQRRVGRAGLPSTTIGLLFHAAEHSTRHVGQAITTARALSAPQTPRSL